MDEILWIRSVDYDPSVREGSQIRPDAGLPLFEVVERRPVVMMFNRGEAWEVKPFTQLKLRIAEKQERVLESRAGAGIRFRARKDGSKSL